MVDHRSKCIDDPHCEYRHVICPYHVRKVAGVSCYPEINARKGGGKLVDPSDKLISTEDEVKEGKDDEDAEERHFPYPVMLTIVLLINGI